MGNIDNPDFRRAHADEVEEALKGTSKVDLYVFLATTSKHILFIPAHEPISPSKLENLRTLGTTNLYVKRAALADIVARAESSLNEIEIDLDPATTFDGENLGAEAGRKLQNAYQSLLSTPPSDVGQVTTLITGMTDKILAALAPESGDLRAAVMKNIKNIRFMNHSAAITSIAVLCALANEFQSRTAFQNICHAVLLMDSSLAELEDMYLDMYYKNRRELPSHVLEKVMVHPVKSQQMIAYLPFATETISQLILHHHELHNGKGYHRGVRTSSVLPLARVLALAVDIYETMKAAEMNGRPMNLKVALQELQELKVEPHNRRHSAKVVQSVVDFLGIKD